MDTDIRFLAYIVSMFKHAYTLSRLRPSIDCSANELPRVVACGAALAVSHQLPQYAPLSSNRSKSLCCCHKWHELSCRPMGTRLLQ